MREPSAAYAVVTTAPLAVSPDSLPRVHEYLTIPASSVDALASSVHVRPTHFVVKLATGGAPAGNPVTVTVSVAVEDFPVADAVTVSVTVYVPSMEKRCVGVSVYPGTPPKVHW